MSCPRPIIVIDDERDVREAIADALQRTGHEVLQAEDGAAALDVLRTIPRPCVAFIDIQMPVMDGPTLIACLKADARLAMLPIVVVSGSAEVSPAGTRRLIRKPVTLGQLDQAVRDFCSSTHARSENDR